MPARSASDADVEALRAQVQALQAENAALRAGGAGTETWVARALLHAPFPAIVHADDGEVLALSDDFVQRTGYARTEIRTIDDWIVRAYEDRHAEIRSAIAERFRTGAAVRDVEVTVRTADGRQLRWVCSASPPERLPDGRAFAVVLAADVTDERSARAVLEESEARARLALDAARLGLWSLDPATGAGYQDARTRAIIGLDEATTLSLADALGRVVHPDDQAAVAEAVAAALDPAGEGRLSYTYRVQVPGRALLWVRATGRTRFEGEERRAVRVDGTLEDVTARVEAEQTLRESETRFRILADAMPQLVFMLGADGQATFFNGQFYRYTGEDKGKGAPESRSDYIHDDDRAPLIARWTEAAENGEAFDFEYRLRRYDGVFRWHLMRAVPLAGDDGLGWIVSSTDIEAIKEAQIALEVRETQFRDLANAMPQLGWMADAAGWIFWYNARWYEYTGTRRNRWKAGAGSPYTTRTCCPRPPSAGRPRSTPASRSTWSFPSGAPTACSGSFLTRVAPLHDADGQVVRWFGTNTDVSTIRTMEAALRTSEAHFRNLADSLPQIVYVRSEAGTLDYVNARWYEYTGAAPGEDTDAYVHPEDLTRIQEAYAQAAKAEQTFEAELRLRRSDDVYRWHLTRITPARGTDGQRRWYGTSTDIHDSRATREALAQQARLLDLSHDAIFVWDHDDGITFWNRGATDLYGYSSEEALGHAARTLLHTVLPTGERAFYAALERRREWIGMLQHTTKDGRTLHVESRWQLLPGPDGSTRVLETTRDVTARLEAEAQLHALNAELQALNGQLETRVADPGEYQGSQPGARRAQPGAAGLCLRGLARPPGAAPQDPRLRRPARSPSTRPRSARSRATFWRGCRTRPRA